MRKEVGGRTAPVLVVDDDPMMTRFLGLILAKEGVETVQVNDVEEAWRIFQEQPHGFRAVLTDVIMPGEYNGVELARKIRKLSPGTPVILVTGFLELVKKGNDPIPFPILEKPFGRDALIAALAKVA